MGQFRYKARASTGTINEGVLEAPDLRSATDRLRSQKFIVMEISESKKSNLLGFLKIGGKVKSADLTIFSRQLSTLVSSGVPIVQGLSILEEQITNKTFKDVVAKLRTDIESGLSITDAMAKHKNCFSELYVSMIKAGEIGGILDVILDRLSGYMEDAEALKGKIKGAMMYPMVIGIIAVLATTFLLTGVIPQFATIFISMGVELPLPTRIVLALSGFLKSFWYLVFSVPIICFIAFKQSVKRIEAFAFKVDAIKLKIPAFGILIKKLAISKFSRTFSTLVKSGVPILQALDTVAKTAGNKVIEKAILAAREKIREGERLSPPLKKSGVFPPMVVQMISVGEETGTLDVMLAKVSDFYEREVDDAVKGLTSMIEPIVIVLMGAVIGTIVLAMFLPMFQMTDMMAK